MNDREREAYLNRIGYEGELRTDKKCLEKIMDLHLCSIPFENLAKVKRVLALVNGNEKIDAVTGALKLGIVTDIIIDEALAEGIIARLS